ncbi:MAG: DUF4824 family protein [Betaproteobacteria bacterium]|nr:DUF4824 family protein [Betaproteobacteria bacterium]
MSQWSKRHTWIAGIAVILLTNAVALGNVAWNRAGSPDSVLKLSQRELLLPYWGVNDENSGLSLELQWRYSTAGASGTGSGDWLDTAKMESLGFKVGQEGGKGLIRPLFRQPSRSVLLVLELDGQAYRRTREEAQHRLAEAQAKLAAAPDQEALKRDVASAKAALEQEEKVSSRLFAVDAGLELAALRAQYPDRGRYLIVPAQLYPYGGFRTAVTIHVPFAFRAGLERGLSQPASWPARHGFPFAATVAFGQHLEPWILDLAVTPR